MSRIDIVNLHRKYNFRIPLLKNIIRKIIRIVKSPGSLTSLDVVFMGDKAIKVLNRRHKGENTPTDVLSFRFDDESKSAVFTGEVIISVDRALENSRIFKTGLEEELVLYVIHGILHLFGYDDQTRRERARMESAQAKILKGLCTRENLSKVLTRR